MKEVKRGGGVKEARSRRSEKSCSHLASAFEDASYHVLRLTAHRHVHSPTITFSYGMNRPLHASSAVAAL